MPTADAMPRKIETIEQQLTELRDLISQSTELQPSDFASELAMSSMQAMERELVDEIKAAQLLTSEAVVQISLDGNAVRHHAIDTKLLGAFLLHLQALANAMGQASAGYVTRSGAIQHRILEENRLFVSSFMPSSFAINFSHPADEASALQPLDLDPETNQVPDDAPDSLDFLYKFFDGKTSLGDLVEIVSIPKAKKHYTQIVGLLEKYDVSLEMRTRRQPFGAKLTASAAGKRKAWITTIQNDVRPLKVTGVLNTGHIRFNNFEVQDDEGNIYIGRTTDYAQYWIKHIPLGSRVRAEILETIEKHGQAEVDLKTDYLLRWIEPVEVPEGSET